MEHGESVNSPNPPLLRTENLSKVYESAGQPLVIFEDLNLTVAAGEMVAIVGESGSGKSTLLHLLGGLDRPTRGTIQLGSLDLAKLSDRDLATVRNREIGFVWQTHYLLPEFTALENVMMPLLIGGVKREDAEPTAFARLEEVGLQQRASHRSGELSGGEQQRVVLARALVRSPRLLLADEPTGNLDFRTGEIVMDLLAELHRTHQLTSVLVTHNLGYARRCQRIISIEKGSVVVQTGGADARLGEGVTQEGDGTHYV